MEFLSCSPWDDALWSVLRTVHSAGACWIRWCSCWSPVCDRNGSGTVVMMVVVNGTMLGQPEVGGVDAPSATCAGR